MKGILKKFLNRFGYELRKTNPFPIGSPQRPVGNMRKFLEDIRSRGLKCDYILDIGAHIGSWTNMAKEIFPGTKFIMIEPQVEFENALKAITDEIPGSLYFIAGAGAKPEKKYLTIWNDPSGSSFLPHESEHLKDSGKQRQIDIITIDALLSEGKITVPELVKLDVQGYELEALKGATTLFGKTEAFILETSFFSFSDVPGMPLLLDVVNFMADRGYVIYDFPGFGRRPLDGALGQCDICFVKSDSFLRKSNDWA